MTQLPSIRAAAYSCEASTDLELARDVAEGAKGRAGYYSVGIISDQQDLAAQARSLLDPFGIRCLFHPIDMDLSGTDPLDERLLRDLHARADELDAPWVTSDLAMWTRNGEILVNNLVPMPLIAESVDWCARRISAFQDAIGRPVAIENPPYPFIIGDEDVLVLMAGIVERTGCLACIDVGHLYGLRRQRGMEPVQPSDDDFCWEAVVEVHLAGSHEREISGVPLFEDYHPWPVSAPVLALADELVPRAINVRAVVAEAEFMPFDQLVTSIVQIDSALNRWFPNRRTEP